MSLRRDGIRLSLVCMSIAVLLEQWGYVLVCFLMVFFFMMLR